MINNKLEGSSRRLTELTIPMGETEENRKNHGQDSRSQDRDLNLGPPEHKAGVLTTTTRLSTKINRKCELRLVPLRAQNATRIRGSSCI
jgi:hypothetical protein